MNLPKLAYHAIILAMCSLGAIASAEGAKAVDGKTMPVDQFLKYMRYPRVQNSWMTMTGRLENKSHGDYFKVPIEIRGRFQAASWRMQVIVSNRERWFIRQNFSDGEFGTSKIQEQAPIEGERSLADYMIRPEDITLSFLYWTFVKEEKSESVSAQQCRVLRLRHAQSGEEAVVWGTTKYFFPMKVRWFKKGETSHYRELKFLGVNMFKPKSNPEMKFAMVDELKVFGKGWSTKITFEKPAGDIVTDTLLPPVDLFIRDEPAEDEMPVTEDKSK